MTPLHKHLSALQHSRPNACRCHHRLRYFSASQDSQYVPLLAVLRLHQPTIDCPEVMAHWLELPIHVRCVSDQKLSFVRHLALRIRCLVLHTDYRIRHFQRGSHSPGESLLHRFVLRLLRFYRHLNSFGSQVHHQ